MTTHRTPTHRWLAALQLLLTATVLFAPATEAQTAKPPPSADSLRAITARGIALAEYDAAAWHASDAVMAMRPSADAIRGYAALQTPSGWVVAFGRLTALRDTFLVAYEARQVPAHRDSFVVREEQPVRADTGDVARAARAIELARGDFGAQGRPYNFAVLRSTNGWLVYAMPAQTQADVWPLGGDVRYLIAADGRSVITKRRMHQQILEVGEPKGGASPVAGTHSAVLDDIPEDSDVFHVLVREPHMPELIVTNAFIYRVEPDGTIKLMGRREAIRGR